MNLNVFSAMVLRTLLLMKISRTEYNLSSNPEESSFIFYVYKLCVVDALPKKWWVVVLQRCFYFIINHVISKYVHFKADYNLVLCQREAQETLWNGLCWFFFSPNTYRWPEKRNVHWRWLTWQYPETQHTIWETEHTALWPGGELIVPSIAEDR